MVVALYNTAGLFFSFSWFSNDNWPVVYPHCQGGSPSKVFNSLRRVSNDKNSITSNIKIATENVTKYVVLTHLRHEGKYSTDDETGSASSNAGLSVTKKFYVHDINV